MYYVPKQMKEKNSWGFWTLTDKDGKKTKIPINAKTLQFAKTNEPLDWCSYEECYKKAFMVKNKISGLSFRFAKNQNIVFIDLDHCIDEHGNKNEFAKEVCERFKYTYQELSQSKTGIHIFAIGNIEKAVHTDKIEMYDWGRYVAFTGNCINKQDLYNYQDEINKLYEENVPKKEEYKPIELPYNPQDERSVLENIKKSRSAYRFQELFSGMVESNSENTLALASILAFWTQRNHNMIKDIMLKSGLYREKMLSKRNNITWLDLVIEKAIQSCREVYKPIEKNEYKATNQTKELKEIQMYGVELYKYIDEIEYKAEMKPRVLSHFPALDKLIGGFTYDCITLWSSQTNGGKSTLLGQISRELIKQGKKVFYFAGEHTYENLQNILYKQLAQKEDIICKKYNNTEVCDYFIKPEKLHEIQKFYRGNILIYNNEASRDIDTMIYAMTEANEKEHVKDFIIDNLMQLEITSNEINKAQTDIVEKLRRFAIDRKCNIHLVAHPRKGLDNSIRLSIFDVSGSMNIANKSYNIISIIRKDQLREGTKEYEEIKMYCYHQNYDFDKCDCILEVLKQKEGTGTGIVCLKFDKITRTFEQLPKEDMSYKLNQKKGGRNHA